MNELRKRLTAMIVKNEAKRRFLRASVNLRDRLSEDAPSDLTTCDSGEISVRDDINKTCHGVAPRRYEGSDYHPNRTIR